MPKISIIVPVYNTEKYLRPCLDSILAQTVKNFEAILVDDGSKDQSGVICDEYRARDPRFVVVHKQNEGVAKARISGFEHSKGELITFIDADDYVSSSYLEKLSKPILEDDADMVSCWHCDVDAVTKNERRRQKVKNGTYTGSVLQDFISNYLYDPSIRGFGMPNMLWGKMVKRQYVEQGLQAGIGMWFGEDQVGVFTMLYQIKKLCIIPDVLYSYVHYQEQTTQRYDFSLWESLIKMFQTYEKLDVQNMCSNGLHKRTWLYVIRTIQQKMIPTGINMKTFVEHLTKVRRQPYMQQFFKESSCGFGWQDDVKYWLLKLRMLRCYYVLCRCNVFVKNLYKNKSVQ